jgi:hypothetical protein
LVAISYTRCCCWPTPDEAEWVFLRLRGSTSFG